jgi:hypothetical protein
VAPTQWANLQASLRVSNTNGRAITRPLISFSILVARPILEREEFMPMERDAVKDFLHSFGFPYPSDIGGKG